MEANNSDDVKGSFSGYFSMLQDHHWYEIFLSVFVGGGREKILEILKTRALWLDARKLFTIFLTTKNSFE